MLMQVLAMTPDQIGALRARGNPATRECFHDMSPVLD